MRKQEESIPHRFSVTREIDDNSVIGPGRRYLSELSTQRLRHSRRSNGSGGGLRKSIQRIHYARPRCVLIRHSNHFGATVFFQSGISRQTFLTGENIPREAVDVGYREFKIKAPFTCGTPFRPVIIYSDAEHIERAKTPWEVTRHKCLGVAGFNIVMIESVRAQSVLARRDSYLCLADCLRRLTVHRTQLFAALGFAQIENIISVLVSTAAPPKFDERAVPEESQVSSSARGRKGRI